jgi:hypothetical protein
LKILEKLIAVLNYAIDRIEMVGSPQTLYYGISWFLNLTAVNVLMPLNSGDNTPLLLKTGIQFFFEPPKF